MNSYSRNRITISIALLSMILIFFPIYFLFFGYNSIIEQWGLISIIIVSVAILAIIMEFSRQKPTSRDIALIIVLGTTIAALRIPFAALPSIQPCTFLIIICGIAFGSVTGFMIGIMTPLISNLFLGHGPWTPLQMYAWGVIGAMSAVVRFNPTINRWKLGLLGILSGYFYGFVMNIWFWYSFLYPHNIFTFVFAQIQGIGFDTLHALSNFLFLVILGNRILPIFKNLLE
ncbi:ECF transporter S component [Thermoproteota archaeon]